jgi:hypothetical protein
VEAARSVARASAIGIGATRERRFDFMGSYSTRDSTP